MKKPASAKKPAAKKPATPQAAVKRTVAARSSGPEQNLAAPPSLDASRAQAEVEKAKYTPSPLKSDGWPAFRYPLG